MKKKTKKKLTPGPFYIDAEGKRRDDGLHDAMLNNPEADLCFQLGAFKAAIARGVPEADACRMFGIPARTATAR